MGRTDVVPAEPGQGERLLTTDEVAGRLGVSPRKVKTLVARRELRSLLIGRSRRIPASAVRDYIAARLDEAAS